MIDKTETKTVYAYSTDGKFISPVVLDYTDRSQTSGVWQLPAGTTELLPIEAKEGYNCVFRDNAWQYVEQEKQEEREEVKPTEAQTVQQGYSSVDSSSLDLAQAVLELSDRIEKLEGGNV